MYKEEHLQAFWYKQAAELKKLHTHCGQAVELLNIGDFNYNQGPDFLNARIKIGEVEWAGHVELHVRTSDWLKHHHQQDTNYQNIILHVVWINDVNHFSLSPILELSKFVSIQQLDNCEYSATRYYLNCSSMAKTVINVSHAPLLQELGFKRLIYRKEMVLKLFHYYKLDYASALWRLIFRCFGRTTNADAFENLYTTTPIHVVRLYAFDPFMLEALLMGQANLITNVYKDAYATDLQKCYIVLKKRHDLKPINTNMKWLRMRPRNFPTIRIAQLAAFYHRHLSLVNELLEITDLEDIDKLFDIVVHPYWKRHFMLDQDSPEQEKVIGNGLRHQIVLHAFVPFLLAYGRHQEMNVYVDRAMDWVFKLIPEQNSLMQSFYDVGFKAANIFDTQALHELYLQHCLQKNCNNCTRGSQLFIS